MTNASGEQYEGVGRDSNMAAYDQLPYYLRKVLANLDHNYAARQVLRDIQSRRLPRNLVERVLRDNDRKLHEQLAAEGWIPGGQR